MSWHVHYRIALRSPLSQADLELLKRHHEEWSEQVSDFSGGYWLEGGVGVTELKGEAQPSGDRLWVRDALTIVRALLAAEVLFRGQAFVEDPEGNDGGWRAVRDLDLPKLERRLLEAWDDIDLGLESFEPSVPSDAPGAPVIQFADWKKWRQ